MSKRQLKKYLDELKKEELVEQVMDLYARFKDVKTYYDFAFNPNEVKLIEEAKFKISKEYFPVNGRRPKMRRSVAQKYIKHFIRLGVDAPLVADIMLYNIEIAQAYSADHAPRQEAFYKSMFTSFEQVLNYLVSSGYYRDFKLRVDKIVDKSIDQNWINYRAFENAVDNIREQ